MQTKRVLPAFILLLTVACSGGDTHVEPDMAPAKDLGEDLGFDPGTPEVAPEPELVIEACLLEPTGDDADCSEDLSLDLGVLALSSEASGTIRLENKGGFTAELTDIIWKNGDDEVDQDALVAFVINLRVTNKEFSVTIPQEDSILVDLTFGPGLAPGDLPADSVDLLVVGDNGEELVFVVTLSGSVEDCPEGSLSCDDDWINGCEVDSTSDTENCSACDAACSVVHGTASCVDSACVAVCDEGWSSDLCDTNIDECTEGTAGCDTDATCADSEGSFDCSCNAGFEGDGLTCADVDECVLDTDNCSDDATCTNSHGAFTCACDAGFEGDGLTCTDVDECSVLTDNCSDNATCTNTAGGFDCGCNEGFDGDGITCNDLDECTLGTDSCDTNATCSNTVGGFDCGCNEGFEGDGLTCNDQDECTLGTAGCDANATCTNNEGSFACNCNSGFEGDGSTCANIDECALASHNCDANASCTDSVGSFNCACNAGFEGSGTACTDIDECATNAFDCDPNASCVNEVGSFSCACNEGFVGDDVCLAVDGGTCTEDAACVNTCINGACSPISGTNGDCDATEDCAEGHECTGGSCLLPDGALCSADLECVNTCIAGLCLPLAGTNETCDDDDDCAGAHSCISGLCVVPDGGACANDSDCLNTCISGTCGVPSEAGGGCDSDADCTPGLGCGPGGNCGHPSEHILDTDPLLTRRNVGDSGNGHLCVFAESDVPWYVKPWNGCTTLLGQNPNTLQCQQPRTAVSPQILGHWDDDRCQSGVACIGYQVHTAGSNTATGFTTGYNCWTGQPFQVGWDDTFFFNNIKIYCY